MVDTMYIYHKIKSREKYNSLINKINNYIRTNNSIKNELLHTDNNVSNSVVTHTFTKKGIEEMRFKSLYTTLQRKQEERSKKIKV